MSKYSGHDDVKAGDVIKMKAPTGDYTVMSWPPSDAGYFSGYGGEPGRGAMRTLREDQILSVKGSDAPAEEEPDAEPEAEPDVEPVEVEPESVTVDAKATTKPAGRKGHRSPAKKASTDGKTTRKS